MEEFLSLTLAQRQPVRGEGESARLRWYWRGPGVLELVPAQPPCCDLVLSAGIHGDETAPIELLVALLDALLTGQQPLAVRLLLVLGNPAAMAAGKRYLEVDLNRLFGGRHREVAQRVEAQRAHFLEQVLERFWQQDPGRPRFHYDLHTAIRDSLHTRFALLPSQLHSYSPALLAWLSRAGISALVQHTARSGTFSHFSSERFGAQSCTLELGKARPFGQNAMGEFAAVAQALAAQVSNDEAALAALPATTPAVFRVCREMRKQSEAFALAFAADLPNFTRFSRGSLLATDGEIRHQVQAEEEYLLFPNAGVRPGLRAGLLLVPQPFDALLE